MTSDDKKKQERRIFDLVYADRSFDEVKSAENPDFLVRYFPNSSYFGVEITEFYISETNARIDNIEGYTGELLNGKRFKHKDDKKVLDISIIDIVDETGIVKAKDVSAIKQEMPSISDYAKGVAERIIFKAELLKNSRHNISHTNLIIEEKSDLLRLINRKDFYSIFFTPELISAIEIVPFREIFFITTLENERVYIPLRMLYLLAEAYLFNGLIIQFRYGEKIPPEINYFELFAAYLNSNVTCDVLIDRNSNDTEIIFGDYGLLIKDNGSVTLRLHMDYAINPKAVSPNIKWQNILGENFKGAMRNYRISNIFQTEIAFPVKIRHPKRSVSADIEEEVDVPD